MNAQSLPPGTDPENALILETTPGQIVIKLRTDVAPGHVITGPAILEAESTTFAVPPDRSARLDEHRIFHLTTIEER